MTSRPSLRWVLIGAVLFGWASVQAQNAPAESPAATPDAPRTAAPTWAESGPSPTPDPAIAERRKLAEKLGALSAADYTAYLRAHPADSSPKMVVGLLAYAEYLGYHNDNAGEARLIDRAGEMADLLGDDLSHAHVLWNRATVEGSHHNVDKSIAMLGQALDLATRAKAPPKDIAGILSARIIARVRKGEYAKARADCDRALQLSTEANYQDGAMATLCALANIYQRQGQPERALPYLEQARIWAKSNERFLVYVDDNYGAAYKLMGQWDKAREYLSRGLASARHLDNGNLTVEILNENIQAALESGDPAGARPLLDEALALAQRLGLEREQVETRVHLAEWTGATGEPAEAETRAREALTAAQASGEREFVWNAQLLLGRATLAQGRPAEAEIAFRAAVDTIENIRAGAAGDEEGSAAVLEKRVEPYRRLVALLVAEGKVPEALTMAENAKARVLRDILQNGRVDLASALTDAERTRRATAAERVATLNRQWREAQGGKQDTAAIQQLQQDLDAARIAERNLNDDLLSAHPEVQRRTGLAGESASADSATPRFDTTEPGTLLLEYVSTPDGLLLFAAGPERQPLAAYPMPDPPEQWRSAVAGFRGELADRSPGWREAAGKLGGKLLGPVRERLARARRVVIVPDGPLWDLPFQALSGFDDPACLVDRLPVSYAPSAAFLAQGRRNSDLKTGLAPTATPLLAMGNPALGSDASHNPAAMLMGDAFAPLPSAEEEVRQLAKLYGETDDRVFLGERAREEVFKREAPRAEILHLATHGLLNDANPLYSCLLMAQTDLGPGEDGLLEAREIMDLHLHARLAVLAACETARGRAAAGEGQLGLSWALLVAGCPASVVSQWKVDSRSNVDLMVELHRQLRTGKPADEALRLAALTVRKTPGYENPFYWAPFVVVGDAR